MSAVILCKRLVKGAASALAVLFVVVSLCYAWFLSEAKSVSAQKNFYFLVSTSTHVQASTHDAVQSGGAGYLLTRDEAEYVAFSVYLSESEGERVLDNLGEEGVRLITVHSGKLYFKTAAQKKTAKTVTNAFSCLNDCIELLNGAISRLEKGATQASSKRILMVLNRQFAFLKKEYAKSFPAFATVCKEANESLDQMTSSVVYTRDLRYLLCELCDAYVALSGKFSL